MKLTLILHNIRSVYNVGAILRTAEGLGVEKVIYSGYTPRYEDANLLPHLREKLNRQIAKSALGAEKLVPQVDLLVWDKRQKDDEKLAKFAQNQQNDVYLLTKYLKYATMEGYTNVGLENNLAESELPKQLILGKNITKNGEKITLGDKVNLILGEEVEGIPPEIRAELDYFLEIPMYGQKESFNVSVATGIAVWGLQNYYQG